MSLTGLTLCWESLRNRHGNGELSLVAYHTGAKGNKCSPVHGFEAVPTLTSSSFTARILLYALRLLDVWAPLWQATTTRIRSDRQGVWQVYVRHSCQLLM